MNEGISNFAPMVHESPPRTIYSIQPEVSIRAEGGTKLGTQISQSATAACNITALEIRRSASHLELFICAEMCTVRYFVPVEVVGEKFYDFSLFRHFSLRVKRLINKKRSCGAILSVFGRYFVMN